MRQHRWWKSRCRQDTQDTPIQGTPHADSLRGSCRRGVSTVSTFTRSDSFGPTAPSSIHFQCRQTRLAPRPSSRNHPLSMTHLQHSVGQQRTQPPSHHVRSGVRRSILRRWVGGRIQRLNMPATGCRSRVRSHCPTRKRLSRTSWGCRLARASSVSNVLLSVGPI